MSAAETSPYADKQARFGKLFDSPLGRQVLQEILEAGGVYEAPSDQSSDEILINHGARALALDIAMLAGLLPEVPGSGGRDVVEQPAEAMAGPQPLEGDRRDYAERGE